MAANKETSSVDQNDTMPSFVLRIGKLPFVETAVSKAQSLYQTYGKENSISVVSNTCDMLETKVTQLRATATPIVQQHADKVAMLDTVVNAQLDRVEALYGSITSLPSTATATVMNSNTLTTAEERICSVTNTVISSADSLVDSVLPADEADKSSEETDDTETAGDSGAETEGQDESQGVEPVLGHEALKLLKTARKFSSKVQVRAYAHALKQLHNVQTRSDAATSALKPYTVDLLDYAREHLDRLADDEDDNDDNDDSGLEEVLTTGVSNDGNSLITTLTNSIRDTRKVCVQQSARVLRYGLDTTTTASTRTMHAAQAGTALVLNTPLMAIAAAKDATTIASNAAAQARTTSTEFLQDPKGTVYHTVVAANDYVQPYWQQAETIPAVKQSEELASHVYDYLLSFSQFRTVHDPIMMWGNEAINWFKPTKITPANGPSFATVVKEGGHV
eukprot:m.44316 g.44316  ORF g.44316 m.44316 type:complete len:449 (-) comp13005_c0_seq1:111-1457(-)